MARTVVVPPIQGMAAAVIGYFPPDAVQNRIDLLQSAGYFTYYWENTPANQTSKMQADVVLNLGQGNVGLGSALAQLLDQARAAGFEWLLYFDQDTEFDANSLSFMHDFVRAGNFTPDFAAIRFAEANSHRQLQTKQLIFNSGCLFRLHSPARHRSDFFVEGVDYQYCLDAATKGQKLGQIACVGMKHESIQPLQHYELVGFRSAYRPYPLKRHLQFLYALLRLSGIALRHFQLRYVAIFLRNIFTHLIMQGIGALMILLSRMGLAKKAVYL
jgi:hypothetical protein